MRVAFQTRSSPALVTASSVQAKATARQGHFRLAACWKQSLGGVIQRLDYQFGRLLSFRCAPGSSAPPVFVMHASLAPRPIVRQAHFKHFNLQVIYV